MATGRHVALSVIAGIVANLTRVCVQLAMLPLMAQLLGPEEIGLFILAMPIMNFVLLVTDAGFGESLARESDPNSDAWSSAFWGLLITASLMSLVIYTVSFFVANAASQQRLPDIMLPLAFTVISTALSVIPNARLTRAGRLTIAPVAEIVGQILSAVVAIWMALNHYGVWALVAQFMIVSFTRMLFLNVAGRFQPRFVFRLSSLSTHWGIGGTLLATRMVDMFVRIGENTLISRFLGPANLGNYGYANQIARFTSDTISNPVWSSFYYMVINGKGGSPADVYVRISRLLALILLLGAAIITPNVPFLIPFLFGSKWDATIFPMMIIMSTYPFSALSGLQFAVILNNGKPLVGLMVAVPLSLARIVAVLFGSPWGLVGITTIIALSYLIQYALVIYFVSPIIGNKRRDLIRAVIGPVTAALITGVGLYFLLGKDPTLIWHVGASVIAALCYFAMLLVVDSKRIKSDINLIKSIVKR
jgi:O-antigen/teichoic acid export membrane protein